MGSCALRLRAARCAHTDCAPPLPPARGAGIALLFMFQVIDFNGMLGLGVGLSNAFGAQQRGTGEGGEGDGPLCRQRLLNAWSLHPVAARRSDCRSAAAGLRPGERRAEQKDAHGARSRRVCMGRLDTRRGGGGGGVLLDRWRSRGSCGRAATQRCCSSGRRTGAPGARGRDARSRA